MSNAHDSAADRASILGPTLYFKGDLTAEEDLLILGRVEGSITHSQRLTVGAQGTVKRIFAPKSSWWKARSTATRSRKSVVVKETARICGNILAPTVSIMEGAAFRGTIDMDGKKDVQQAGNQLSAGARATKVSGGAG